MKTAETTTCRLAEAPDKKNQDGSPSRIHVRDTKAVVNPALSGQRHGSNVSDVDGIEVLLTGGPGRRYRLLCGRVPAAKR
jgi:hypothetical protein